MLDEDCGDCGSPEQGGPASFNRRRFVDSAFPLIALFIFAAAVVLDASAQGPATPPARSGEVQIVFLGTGTPRPTPDQQGPSLAIVIGGKAYLVDAGTGIVRQANAAFLRGVTALQPVALDIAFLTHLHADHTLGLPDLILTPWIFERIKPLQLYGPSGTKAMASHILEAYADNLPTGYKVEAHEVQSGIVYRDDNIVVKAFQVKHGSWKEALGYRFEAGSKSIIVSGDTSPAESVISACNACDALIHEVYAGRGSTKPSMSVEQWMKYESQFHTSATELGEIGAKAKAKMLIVTHWTLLGNAKPDDMVAEIRKAYAGPIIIARDLDLVTP